jgi:hypothetical protein
MGRKHVDRSRDSPGDGTIIGILFVVVVWALVGTVGWGLIAGGFDPPSGPAGPRGATPTAVERGPPSPPGGRSPGTDHPLEARHVRDVH